MGMKRFVRKFVTFMNLPVITALENINHSLLMIQSNVAVGRTAEMPFRSVCTEDQLTFVGRAEDECIMPQMMRSSKVWACESIDLFFKLIAEKTAVAYLGGVFLDIGANIGTTSIYACKKQSGINVIAFEAGKDNYDVLRCNCIINRLENSIVCENIALSNTEKEVKYKYNMQNPGGSAIICEKENADENTVLLKTTTLDNYLAEKDIKPEDICCIWMDTEGHEAEIIDGAMTVLRKNPVPLFQEVNPIEYRKKKILQLYLSNMEEIYDHFIDVENYRQGESIIYEIKELKGYLNSMYENNRYQADFFFYK